MRKFAFIFLFLAALAQNAKACELALVLAIDISGSVDTQEYRIQMDGLAAALNDPTVQDALLDSKAQIAVLHWTGASRQVLISNWRQMNVRADVIEIGQIVSTAPREYRHFSTAIGDALIVAADLLGRVGGACKRQVIDVSGDGPSNEGADVSVVRDSLVRGGVQINGLAIETSEDDLTEYYRAKVIGGPGAFVLTAKTFEDYPRAIRRKLLREITKPVVEAPRRRGRDAG